MNEQLTLAISNPFLHAVAFDSLRRACLRSFPYAIYFLPEPEKGALTVLAILHQARDPDWVERRLVWRRQQ